jgi:5'-deoxynucleotidase YfbR-like HD superfamily hydrolase
LTLLVKTVSVEGVGSKKEASRLVELFTEVVKLKSVPRTGWLLRGVRDVESVADHSFGVAVIALLLSDRARQLGKDVDFNLVMRMALLHDLPEARTGDLPSTYKKYIDQDALRVADDRITEEMLRDLGQQNLDARHDYEDRKSIEARIVKAADKLDLLVQAWEYERGGARMLDEFWSSADADFSGLELDDVIVDIVTALKEARKADAIR